MKRKNSEKTFESPEKEVVFLRKQVAGFKGQITFDKKQIADLNKCISELLDVKEANEKTISGLESQVNKLTKIVKEKNDCIKELEDTVVALRTLSQSQKPWYKKMFGK